MMVYLGNTVTREMHFGAKAELFKFARELRKNNIREYLIEPASPSHPGEGDKRG